MLIVASIIIASAAAGFYLLSRSPAYASTASVQLPAQTQQAQAATAGPNLQLVTSDQVASAAANALRRTDAATLAGEVTATYDAVSNVVSVTATTAHASDAPRVANAFAQSYIAALVAQANDSAALLEAQQAKLAAQINALSAQSAARPTDGALKAQLANATILYGTISSQLLQAQIAPAPATLLHSATAAASTAQSKVKVLGLGAVIGLLAGCGIALIRTQFDTRLRTAEEVEELTRRPVLAELPYVRAYRRGATSIPVAHAPRTAFAEAIRELRTSATVLLGGAATPVVVVTSPAPFDGKTLITANLAASWALSGKRTILVGGDLRRPRIHEFFDGQESDKGLSEILAGSSSSADETEQLLRETSIDGLRFLPAGYPHSDPADALASSALAVLIGQLKQLADIVIIDAPPVLAVADAAITAVLADGVIVVARSTKTDSRDLGETMKRLRAGNVTILGTALNWVKGITGSTYGEYYRSPAGSSDARSAEPGAALEVEHVADDSDLADSVEAHDVDPVSDDQDVAESVEAHALADSAGTPDAATAADGGDSAADGPDSSTPEGAGAPVVPAAQAPAPEVAAEPASEEPAAAAIETDSPTEVTEPTAESTGPGGTAEVPTAPSSPTKQASASRGGKPPGYSPQRGRGATGRPRAPRRRG